MMLFSSHRNVLLTKKMHAQLAKLLDKPIAYHPQFAKITGSAIAELLLSYLYDLGKHGDWFCRSTQQLEEETALTDREQAITIRSLTELGILEVSGADQYRINRAALYEVIAKRYG